VGGVSFAPPLFSGAWKLNYYTHNDDVERAIQTRLELHLNPTRYVRYQDLLLLPYETRHTQWPEPRIYADRREADIGDESATDHNDNWLPQTRRWTAFTNPARWRLHLRRYLEGVTGEFERELDRVRSNTSRFTYLSNVQQYNLHMVEHYWEFASENPIVLVASLQPLLRSFSIRCCEATGFPVQDPVSGATYNSLSLKAKAGRGRRISIYSKTNQRIRIEVIHYFHRNNRFVVGGGHTGLWSELPEKLEQLAEDAAELVNRMFECFRNQSDVTPSHIPAYQLLLEIARHARHFPTAITIASALIHLDRVAVEGASPNMQRALRNLKGANILEYQSGAYVVTAPRRHALQTLSEHGNFSVLIARVRRKTSR